MDGEYHRFNNRSDWREWLTENQEGEAIWVILQKVKSPNMGLKYIEALEEALCFGWIDGRVRRIDDYEHVQWYSPRRKNSIWSKRNRDITERLISEGKMTERGFSEIEKAKENGRWEAAYSSKEPPKMPEALIEALKTNPQAYENFNKFPNSAKTMYIHWVLEAKRESTKARRIKTVVERSALDKRPGIDI